MKIAVLTGASSGLGISFLRELCLQRPELDEIWILARRKQRLEELARDCPIKVVPMEADLTDPLFFKRFTEYLGVAHPDIRVLINNAGMGKLGNVADLGLDTQLASVDLNVRALTGMTVACLPYMGKSGEIINICSIAAFAPNPRMTVYSATKAYVLSFSKSLREELKARKIHVLAVCPGPMSTEFLDVAGISGGHSRMFELLPYSDPAKVAAMSLRRSRQGRAVYTPRLFFKFYRLLAKLLPHSLIMKFSKT